MAHQYQRTDWKQSSKPKPAAEANDDSEDEDDIPSLSPSGRAFANLPLGDWEKIYAFIQKDSSILSEASHDALLLEAFAAERRGNKALARRCIHQSLIIKYCRELGSDGVGLFFQK